MRELKIVEGQLTGDGKSVAIIVSRFNAFITERLLEGAVDALIRNGMPDTAITVIRVPGAWEIPLAAGRAASRPDIDGVICLGAVIRGDTPHFDYVAAEVSKGIAAISQTCEKPIGFGVLTTDSVEQAIDRAGAKAGNKGWDTALAVLEMIDLLGNM
jgi:6,7-dimethyl-8-ribityllumazine synthase